MSDPIRDQALTQVETALTSLTPLAPRLDRDYLLFHAGRASVPARGWFWPGTTVAVTLLALWLGWISTRRPRPLPQIQIEERIVYLPAPMPEPKKPRESIPHRSATDDEESRLVIENLARRQEVLLWGVDVLPQVIPEWDAAKPEVLDPLPDLPVTPRDSPTRSWLDYFLPQRF